MLLNAFQVSFDVRGDYLQDFALDDLFFVNATQVMTTEQVSAK